jgi:hypothetical protein
MTKQEMEKLLREVVDAADELIGWYESEHERGNYEDDDLPEDLREVEDEWETVCEKVRAVAPG